LLDDGSSYVLTLLPSGCHLPTLPATTHDLVSHVQIVVFEDFQPGGQSFNKKIHSQHMTDWWRCFNCMGFIGSNDVGNYGE
jgi:hypothetical protein